MSDAMALGAAQASKLRLGDGIGRAQKVLDVIRSGINRQPKSLRALSGVGGKERVVFGNGSRAATGGFRMMDGATLANPDGTIRPNRPGQGLSGGLIDEASPRRRQNAGTMGAGLTPLEPAGGAAARPGSASDDSKGAPRLMPAIVPRYTVRATTGQAISGGLTTSEKVVISAPGVGTSRHSGINANAGGEKSWANGTSPERHYGFAGGTVQNGPPAGGNARAGVTASAPVAASPARRSAMTLPAEPGLQSGGSAGNATPDERGDATSPASAEPNGAASSGPTGGDVYLDGALMGRWVARNLANQAARPASGGAGFDPLRGVFPTGAMIGG